MRISDLFAPLLLSAALAACGSPQENNAAIAKAEADTAREADAQGQILCATGGEKILQRKCQADRTAGPDGGTLVIRHPDGGFRRFKIVTDGRGIVPADGAEKAQISMAGKGFLKVAIGGDQYLVPVTIRHFDK